jgi:hypothetical protein
MTTVTITINEQKIIITPDNDLITIIININKLESHTKKGCDMVVFIYDQNTTNFHKYEFDYLQSSQLNPRKWLLNNILYSITCDKTKNNMNKRELLKMADLLFTEYHKL